MPQTLEKPMPSGFTRVGSGNLPPFFDLPKVGQELYGTLDKVRIETITDKVKVKDKKTGETRIEEVEKEKYYFDITLTKEATGDDASKAHKKVTHEKGTRVTLSGAGALKRAFMDAALHADGKGPEAWPDDGTDPKVDWTLISGLEVYVRRETDGKMGKKSKFPGNKVRQYTVGVAFKQD